jgi:hypothetical protein
MNVTLPSAPVSNSQAIVDASVPLEKNGHAADTAYGAVTITGGKLTARIMAHTRESMKTVRRM